MRSEFLLDVNVLLALAWPTHLHHAKAREWFTDNCASGWASCSITELGFVRLSSNSKVFVDAVHPSEATLQLAAYKAMGRHVFWIDDQEATALNSDISRRVTSHKQVTDAHLIALARQNSGRLVTFDQGTTRLLGADEARTSLVILG